MKKSHKSKKQVLVPFADHQQNHPHGGRFRRAFRRVLPAVVLWPACLFHAPVNAQDTFWNNINGGSFYTASNWSNGIPRTSDYAVFGAFTSADSYNVLFSSDAMNFQTEIRTGRVSFLLNGSTYDVQVLNTTNGGRLGILGGTVNSSSVEIESNGGGISLGSGGRLLAEDIILRNAFMDVSDGGRVETGFLAVGSGTGVFVGLNDPGSAITVLNDLVVGNTSSVSTASFLQTTQGTILTTGGTVVLGQTSSNSGELNIGGIWNHHGSAVAVGSSSTEGALNINGGIATLDGFGSIVTVGGNNQLLVQDNGTLDINGPGLGNGVRLAGTSSLRIDQGTVNIRSTGLRSGLEIGNTSSLVIDNGGQLTTSRLFNALGTIDLRDGSLVIDGGSFEPGLASFNLGGTESVAVELRNGATSDLLPGLVVGSTNTSFRSRQFNVLSGSRLNSLSTGIIGQQGDGSVMRISGDGSTWSHQGAITLGTAEGTLIVEDGGFVTSHGNNLVTGNAGAGGEASLIVQSGGRLDAGVVELSRVGGSLGTAAISGEGSVLNSTGFFVGGSATAEGGTATLNVDAGAEVNVAGTLRARNLGTININGGHVTTQNFTRSSTGTLNFNDGELTVLGSYSNGTGNVTLAGAALNDNPTLTLAGAASTSGITNLNVGSANRQGTVSVHSGAQLLTGALTIGNMGTVNLEGGGLLISSLASTGQFNWNNGTVNFQSSTALNGTTLTSLLGSGHVLGQGRSLGSIGGTMTLDGSLNVNDGGTLNPANLTNNSTLSVNGGQVVTGMLINNAGRSILVSGNSGLIANTALQNSGSLRLNSPAASVSGGQFNNLAGGTVSGTGQINNDLFNSGVIRSTGSEHLVFTSRDNHNLSNINLAGGTIEFTESLFNRSGAAITGRGTLITSSAAPGGLGLVNDGVMSFSAGITDVYGDVDNGSEGRIVTSGAGITTFFDDVTHNGHEIRTFLGSTTVFLGEQTGAGNFTGPGTVEYAGDLRPGNSPASISYEGDVFMNSSVRSFFELGGPEAGEFDQLLIDGDFNVDGDLFVSLINGYSLGAGDSFLIGDVGGSLFGEFSGLSEGALVGNFGGRELFITYAGGNGNDIALFTAVPEPATGIFLLGLFAACLLRRRNRTCPSGREQV